MYVAILVNTSARSEKMSMIIWYKVKAPNIKNRGREEARQSMITTLCSVLMCIMLQHVFGCNISHILFFLWRCGPTRTMAATFLRFLYHTQRRITVGRIPLDERSETFTWLDTTLTTNIRPAGGIRNHHLSRRAAGDVRLILRCHWDRPRP